MRRLLIILLFPFSLYAQDIGGQYYVAPVDSGGSDAAAGTYDAPFATFQKAFNSVSPGDTVYFRGGVYHSKTPSVIYPLRNPAISVSGTEDNWIYYWNYPGETPILDCEWHCDSSSISYNSGISIEKAGFMHFRGITIRNVYQCSDVISAAMGYSAGANFIFENITIHNIGQRGFWGFSGAWNAVDSAQAVDYGGHSPAEGTILFPYDTTYWINCDIYDLCDTFTNIATQPGNAADGWKCHNYDRGYYSWEGCRAWNYTDDGFDPSGWGTRVFNNCLAMSGDKYFSIMSEVPGGTFEGNGFKTSAVVDTLLINGYVESPRVIMRNCLAMFNKGYGFYNNLEGNAQNEAVYYNNTAYFNNISFGTSSKGVLPIQEVYRNNLSVAPQDTNPIGRPTHIAIISDQYIYSNNTFYAKYYTSDTITATSDDFVNGLDSLTLVNMFTAPRDENNDLPTFPLRLVEGSDLIDAGIITPLPQDSTSIAIPYYGDAPDIGAFEWSPTTVKKIYTIGGVKSISIGNGKVIIL